MSSQPPPVPQRNKKKKKRARRKKSTPYVMNSQGQLVKSIPVKVTYNPRNERTQVVGSGGYRALPRAVKGQGGYFADDYFQRLGHEFFGKKGKLVGEGVHSVLKALGLGSYALEENSLLEPGRLDLGGEIPLIANDGPGECVLVTHQEYIGDLETGSGTPTVFDTVSFDLNPSDPDLFPWLQAIANQFEEYELRGMLVVLKTIASDVSTALSLGTMFGAVQYDINDEPFATKTELLNYKGGVSRKVSETVIIPVECKRTFNVLNHLYVATGGEVPADATPQFYNLGRLTIGSEGCPAPFTKIAEVWVTYDLALYKPKLGDGGALALNTQTALYHSTTWTNTAPLTGFADNPSAGNHWRGSLSSTSILFPPKDTQGIWLVYVEWSGAAVTASYPAQTTVGCSAKLLFINGSTGAVDSPLSGAASQQRMSLCIAVTIFDRNATLTFGSAGTLPGASKISGDLLITRLNGNISWP